MYNRQESGAQDPEDRLNRCEAERNETTIKFKTVVLENSPLSSEPPAKAIERVPERRAPARRYHQGRSRAGGRNR